MPGAPGGAAPGPSGAKRKEFIGPDAELAAMLERDIMDGSPGVK